MNNPGKDMDYSEGYPYRPEAEGLASMGRYGDTMLMHVNPLEVEYLKENFPGAITTNPNTGQPEAFLMALLAPLFAKIGIGAGAGATAAAAGTGIGTGVATKMGLGSLLSGMKVAGATMPGSLVTGGFAAPATAAATTGAATGLGGAGALSGALGSFDLGSLTGGLNAANMTAPGQFLAKGAESVSGLFSGGSGGSAPLSALSETLPAFNPSDMIMPDISAPASLDPSAVSNFAPPLDSQGIGNIPSLYETPSFNPADMFAPDISAPSSGLAPPPMGAEMSIANMPTSQIGEGIFSPDIMSGIPANSPAIAPPITPPSEPLGLGGFSFDPQPMDLAKGVGNLMMENKLATGLIGAGLVNRMMQPDDEGLDIDEPESGEGWEASGMEEGERPYWLEWAQRSPTGPSADWFAPGGGGTYGQQYNYYGR